MADRVRVRAHRLGEHLLPARGTLALVPTTCTLELAKGVLLRALHGGAVQFGEALDYSAVRLLLLPSGDDLASTGARRPARPARRRARPLPLTPPAPCDTHSP